MRTMLRFASLAMAALLLGLYGGPAGATPSQPQVIDPAGDANVLNPQGFASGFESGPDTRPISADGADILAVWFQTTYDSIKTLDESGNVLGVHHVAKGLRMNIETSAPAKPTFGPTLVFRVPAVIGQCHVWLQVYLHGSASLPTDPTEHSEFRRLDTTCPGGTATLTSKDFTISTDKNVLTLDYLFSAMNGWFQLPMVISAPSAQVRYVAGLVAATLTAPQIDEAAPGLGFVIGSDVPPDVDCTATPDDPECAT